MTGRGRRKTGSERNGGRSKERRKEGRISERKGKADRIGKEGEARRREME